MYCIPTAPETQTSALTAIQRQLRQTANPDAETSPNKSLSAVVNIGHPRRLPEGSMANSMQTKWKRMSAYVVCHECAQILQYWITSNHRTFRNKSILLLCHIEFPRHSSFCEALEKDEHEELDHASFLDHAKKLALEAIDDFSPENTTDLDDLVIKVPGRYQLQEGVDRMEMERETRASEKADEKRVMVARSPLAAFQRGGGEELECYLWALALHWLQ
ncbi:hypothetical protein C8R45DRAFT_941846 [Mycena sanguinolenta]|nr:hypothetical protein C8R45DRAFT_941846 [Mycena sanguinolenta]